MTFHAHQTACLMMEAKEIVVDDDLLGLEPLEEEAQHRQLVQLQRRHLLSHFTNTAQIQSFLSSYTAHCLQLTLQRRRLCLAPERSGRLLTVDWRRRETYLITRQDGGLS